MLLFLFQVLQVNVNSNRCKKRVNRLEVSVINQYQIDDFILTLFGHRKVWFYM